MIYLSLRTSRTGCIYISPWMASFSECAYRTSGVFTSIASSYMNYVRLQITHSLDGSPNREWHQRMELTDMRHGKHQSARMLTRNAWPAKLHTIMLATSNIISSHLSLLYTIPKAGGLGEVRVITISTVSICTGQSVGNVAISAVDASQGYSSAKQIRSYSHLKLMSQEVTSVGKARTSGHG
jgi:hypothetical protein